MKGTPQKIPVSLLLALVFVGVLIYYGAGVIEGAGGYGIHDAGYSAVRANGSQEMYNVLNISAMSPFVIGLVVFLIIIFALLKGVHL